MTEFEWNAAEESSNGIESNDLEHHGDDTLDAVVDAARRDWEAAFAAAEPSWWDGGWRRRRFGSKYLRFFRSEWLSHPDRAGSELRPVDAEAGIVFEVAVGRDLFLDEQLELCLKTVGESMLEDRLHDHLYSESVQSRLADAAETAGATVRDRTDRASVLYRRVPFRPSSGHTVGGQTAVTLDELRGVGEVVTETVGSFFDSIAPH